MNLVKWDFPSSWWKACWGNSSAWVGPIACVTSATAMQSQAAVSTQEGLRDEGERKQDCYHPLIWEWHYSIPRILHTGTQFQPTPFSLPSVWQSGPPLSFSSYPSRKNQNFLHRWEASSWMFTHGWEEGAKEQFWCAAFSSRTCFRTERLFRLTPCTSLSQRCPQLRSHEDLAVQFFPCLAWSCNRPWDGDLRAHSGSARSQHWLLEAYASIHEQCYSYAWRLQLVVVSWSLLKMFVISAP